MGKIILPVKGMHCRACELLLEEQLGQVAGVEGVRVSQRRGTAEITVGPATPDGAALAAAVHASGYEVGVAESLPWVSRSGEVYEDFGFAALGLLLLAFLVVKLGLLNWPVAPSEINLPLAFVVGLVAGVSSCAAMLSGLVMGLAARHAEAHPDMGAWGKLRPHLFFNGGRVAGFALFGFLLGAIGEVFRLSLSANGLLTALVGGLMVALGLSLTSLFPRLQNRLLTWPSALARRLGVKPGVSAYTDWSAAAAGAATFFIPCGFTQAMQIYAVSTGSPWAGGLFLAVFALGTTPPLFGMAGLASVAKGALARRLFAATGLLLLVFGAFNVSRGVSLAWAGFQPAVKVDLRQAQMEREQPVQEIRMTQRADGYFPSEFTVKRNVPVRWVIDSLNEFTCASSIVVPQLGLNKQLHRGENVIEFTPTEDLDIGFSCAMGMFNGKITVVD